LVFKIVGLVILTRDVLGLTGSPNKYTDDERNNGNNQQQYQFGYSEIRKQKSKKHLVGILHDHYGKQYCNENNEHGFYPHDKSILNSGEMMWFFKWQKI
jgi:hypothetical protein